MTYNFDSKCWLSYILEYAALSSNIQIHVYTLKLLGDFQLKFQCVHEKKTNQLLDFHFP